MTRIFALAAVLAVAACTPGAPADDTPPAQAAAPTEWALVSEDSRIAFASIKAGDIIELHAFDGLSGAISPDGAARVEIPLDRVDTKIPIRDERMRDIFFETATYPTAILTAQIDQSAFADLGVGDRRRAPVLAELAMRGASVEVEADAFVTRIAPNRVEVESAEPVIIFVDDFDLGAGLEQLREIANLPAITPSSPVTFTFVFEG
ncbi:MAG: YceI family protein [Pseudomonadota bacterium]